MGVRLMKQHAKTPRNCLIVGAGALGLLLHRTLLSAHSVSGRPTRIATHNRTTVPEPISIDLGEQAAVPIQTESHSGSVQSCLEKFEPDTLFLCVPPEATEQVLHSWLGALESLGHKDKPVLFVFCNNGCLSATTLSRLSAAHPRFSFLRALFFVGAMRTLYPDQTHVRWTGGTRVAWNWLRTAAGQEQLPHFLEPKTEAKGGTRSPVNEPSAEVATLGFMLWQREQNIFAAERSKFFTNFMLAAAVGPQLAKNKTLSDALGDSIVSLQAQQFAILWEHLGVNAKQLKSTLLSTVADTGENINSLSYAAVQGNTATMEWFLHSIDEDLNASHRIAELEPLVSFLRSVRKKWRMEK
jgi:hypothetical protein